MSVPVVVAISGGAVALALPVMVASQVIVAGAEATNAADAAALAAADAELGLLGDGESAPCVVAQAVADANGAATVTCDLGPGIAEVRVTVRRWAGLVAITRSARAGLAD
ncbi:hypothetical protein FB468_2613 [Leucobacter komagatae]|uniref:Secretion/DNA translocation related TadE-like protein n=1 Tax=Leucobacter komagatae TaxID=55969 RepID=A0A542Y901_9MICO|nr:helicase [Leucobacter komagatae]TQL44553.1 hypothetical protein FB468_2613 [Leucobacter komagatae]